MDLVYLEELILKLEKLISLKTKTEILSQKSVLTLDEACLYTGLSKSYLYKKTRTHEIPFSKPTGKLIYFDINELNKWLLSNRSNSMDELKNRASSYAFKNRKV